MASGMTFVPNTAGIRRVFRSSGMQSALKSAVEPIAARANANFGLHEGDRVPLKAKNGTIRDVKFNGTPKVDPYGAYVDLAPNTAIGKVVCKTELGRYDNSINNTILKSR